MGERRPLFTIRPSNGWTPLNVQELWRFRDLLGALALRDLKLRYRQTALGVIWVLLQPLLAAGIFSFVFGQVAKLPSDGVPYLLFSFAGLLGWNLFSSILAKVSGCMVGNAGLISKVYFPRLLLPLSNVVSVVVDFVVAAALMAVLMVIYGVGPSLSGVLLIFALLLLVALSIGIGLIASALAVPYRDVQYILPVVTQILLYASPVAYSISAVPAQHRWFYELNPLTAPLETIRASLLGTPFPPMFSMATSCIAAILFLITGLFFFKRLEQKFADVI